MNFFLAKCEPESYSIDDLKRDKTTLWDGVRNYQARNYLLSMKKGDLVYFYHSNADPAGIAGVMTVSEEAVVDPLQFDKKSDYYDPKATEDNPKWFSPVMKFKERFKEVISLEALKGIKDLSESPLLRKGNRLSVIPLSEKEYQAIYKLKR